MQSNSPHKGVSPQSMVQDVPSQMDWSNVSPNLINTPISSQGLSAQSPSAPHTHTLPSSAPLLSFEDLSAIVSSRRKADDPPDLRKYPLDWIDKILPKKEAKKGGQFDPPMSYRETPAKVREWRYFGQKKQAEILANVNKSTSVSATNDFSVDIQSASTPSENLLWRFDEEGKAECRGIRVDDIVKNSKGKDRLRAGYRILIGAAMHTMGTYFSRGMDWPLCASRFNGALQNCQTNKVAYLLSTVPSDDSGVQFCFLSPACEGVVVGNESMCPKCYSKRKPLQKRVLRAINKREKQHTANSSCRPLSDYLSPTELKHRAEEELHGLPRNEF